MNSKNVRPSKTRPKAKNGKNVINHTMRYNKFHKKNDAREEHTHSKKKSPRRKRGRSASTHRSEKRFKAAPKRGKKRKPSVSIARDSSSEYGSTATLVGRLANATIDSLNGAIAFSPFSRTQFWPS